MIVVLSQTAIEHRNKLDSNADLEDHRVLPYIVGESPGRSRLPLLVIVLLLLASGGFVIGMDIGLSLGWIILALGIATVAGFIGAGSISTIGLLWHIGFW